jgi:hypothetical protein
MRAVRDHGTELVDDPDRLTGVTALGMDETSFLRARRDRPRCSSADWSTRLPDGWPTSLPTAPLKRSPHGWPAAAWAGWLGSVWSRLTHIRWE